MTHRSIRGIGKRIKKREDLTATLAVRDSELRNEREKNRDLSSKLEDAEREVKHVRSQLTEMQMSVAQEQESAMAHLNQEMDALKRQTAFWMRAVPDPQERNELASLLEWQLTLHGRIAGLLRSINGRHELIADLQKLERKASLDGRQEDFDELHDRIEVCYKDVASFRDEVNYLRAVVATKVMPMIDRVMSGEYRAFNDEVSYSEEEETDEEIVCESPTIPTEFISTDAAVPTHQPLTVLDRYELGLVFAGADNEKEIVDLLRWLISEDFAKRLSRFVILIEEDALEPRIAKIADLKKWSVEAQSRARKLMRLLLEALPIWISNDLSSRQIELRIDREGKLQQFLSILDWRFKQRIAQREQLQQVKEAHGRKDSKVGQDQKPVSPVSQTENPKVVESGIRYSGKRIALHRDLIGKEHMLLDYVPLGHFFGDSIAAVAYSRLKNDGYISDLEQTLCEARRKELVKRIEQQIIVNGGTPQGRSVNGMIKNAQRIEVSVASLPIFTADGRLDKEKAIERAYDILTTQEGYNSYVVLRHTRNKRANK